MKTIEEVFTRWSAKISIKNMKFNIRISPTSDLLESDLKDIASIINTRYNLANFKTLLGGLDATVNVFKKYLVVVSSFDEVIHVLILPKNGFVDENLISKFLDAIKEEKVDFFS